MTALAMLKLDEISDSIAEVVVQGFGVPNIIESVKLVYMNLKHDVKGYTPLIGKFIEYREYIPPDIREIIIRKLNNFSKIINISYTPDFIKSYTNLENVYNAMNKYYPDIITIKNLFLLINDVGQEYRYLYMLASKLDNSKDNPVLAMIEILSDEEKVILEKLKTVDPNDVNALLFELITNKVKSKMKLDWVDDV